MTEGTAGAEPVAYADLPPDAKRAFDRALSTDRAVVESPDDGSWPYLRGRRRIRYEGRLYRFDYVSWVVETSISVERVHRTPTSHETVVAYDDLSPAARRGFDEALETGEYRMHAGQFPQELESVDYVRREGAAYALTHGHYDRFEDAVVRLERVGETTS